MPKQKVALLIDGDPIAYIAAERAEIVHVFDDIYVNQASITEAFAHASSQIKSLADQLKADRIILTLSPNSRKYWRHDVMPTYKGARKGSRGPICIKDLKDMMSKEWETERWDGLEADDVLGILATDSDYLPDHKKIVVSIDKDMKTLPDTWIYNPDQDYQPWFNKREEADSFFLSQAIGGDTTDGYSGVIGMSVDSAATFLSDPWFWESYEHTFKSGPRKGLSERRWRKIDSSGCLWTDIVSLFHKAGQTEQDALDNARVARICRISDYDYDLDEVVLVARGAEVKHKELTVQIVATLKVGYNQDELEEMGKSFREFKHGVERVVKSDLLPAFQEDPHSEVEVLTVGFPSKRKLQKQAKNQQKLKG